MRKQAETGETARMFIALELPQVIREMIGEWGEAKLVDAGLRRVPVESLHLTLAFLGDRPLAEVDRIGRILEERAEHPVMLDLDGPVVRPEHGAVRFVALPTDSNPVRALASELSGTLTFEGLLEGHRRALWPHVTVARVRSEADDATWSEILLGPKPTASYGWFEAVRVSLYRSELQSSGARYVPLVQVELPHRGWQ
jgi:2'-5' RNA ligase